MSEAGLGAAHCPGVCAGLGALQESLQPTVRDSLACLPSRTSHKSCVRPGQGSFLLVGTYSPFKSSYSLQRGASLHATHKAASALLAPCPEDQTVFISSPKEGKRNITAYGESLLSKERQAFMHCIGLVELANEKANPRERLQNQQNHCSPAAAGGRPPVLPMPALPPAVQCPQPPSPPLPPGLSSPALLAVPCPGMIPTTDYYSVHISV